MNVMIAIRRFGVSQAIAPDAASGPRIECISRRCAGPGSFRIAREISFRPRRSAIRIVAEFAPLVDLRSRVRSRLGTSSTERYTRSEPRAEMSTVDV